MGMAALLVALRVAVVAREGRSAPQSVVSVRPRCKMGVSARQRTLPRFAVVGLDAETGPSERRRGERARQRTPKRTRGPRWGPAGSTAGPNTAAAAATITTTAATTTDTTTAVATATVDTATATAAAATTAARGPGAPHGIDRSGCCELVPQAACELSRELAPERLAEGKRHSARRARRAHGAH